MEQLSPRQWHRAQAVSRFRATAIPAAILRHSPPIGCPFFCRFYHKLRPQSLNRLTSRIRLEYADRRLVLTRLLHACFMPTRFGGVRGYQQTPRFGSCNRLDSSTSSLHYPPAAAAAETETATCGTSQRLWILVRTTRTFSPFSLQIRSRKISQCETILASTP